MNLIRNIAPIVVACSLLFSSLAAAAGSFTPLQAPPLGARWYSISMGDDRTGFSHSVISAAAGGYEISCEASVRMKVLGFSREASSRETYLVNRDLSLRAFDVEQTIDGSKMRITGETSAGGVSMKVHSAGETREMLLKARGAVYPPEALNIYPLMKRIVPGKKYKVTMLDLEKVDIKDVKITVLGRETLPGGIETVHLRNDLYPFVDNDIWVDLAGKTVRESVRDGLIVTTLEEEASTRQFILDAAIAKRDLVLDFSLIRIDRPVERPRELKKLVLELTGFPEAMPLLSDDRQNGVRHAGGRVVFTVENNTDAADVANSAAGPHELRRYLEPNDRILSNHGEIIAEKDRILKGEKDPRQAVQVLIHWVAAAIGESVTDSHTSLEVLRNRQGNCQSHARLYAALARAAGIPTRFVSGIVYLSGNGFLYHSWAESYVGRWLAVDPTFGQVPADVTHIKLVEGDSPGEMAAIGGVVGRLKGKIVEETY